MTYKWCICSLIALLSAISSITANKHHANQTASHIVVDPSGRGGFITIQAAIDSVPSSNKKWITIDIKAGVYREQVLIPQNKPFIYLKGAGKGNTFFVWDAHENIATSATFASEADNTLAKGITFANSYNSPPDTNHNPRMPAVAARIKGDKSAFYQCGFLGLQDTLWDVQGRHYYKSCTIEGAIDFIFGAAQTHFENCIISVASLNARSGYIAAQGREHPQDTNGFVFKNCKIVGKGKTYLGRPWREYARVLYYKTHMSEVVVPQGWEAWGSAGREQQLTLSEYNCSGPGARSSERVKWAKKLSREEVERLTSTAFIDSEGWVKKALAIMGAN